MNNKFYIKDGKKYRLEGKCVGCGNCCRVHIYYETDEGVVTNITTLDKREKCTQFDEENSRCLQHETKPYICRTFPTTPKELEVCGCKGFAFIYDKETDEPDTIFYVTPTMTYTIIKENHPEDNDLKYAMDRREEDIKNEIREWIISKRRA